MFGRGFSICGVYYSSVAGTTTSSNSLTIISSAITLITIFNLKTDFTFNL